MPSDVVPESLVGIFPLEVPQRVVDATMVAVSLHHLGQRICDAVEFRSAQLGNFAAGLVPAYDSR